MSDLPKTSKLVRKDENLLPIVADPGA